MRDDEAWCGGINDIGLKKADCKMGKQRAPAKRDLVMEMLRNRYINHWWLWLLIVILI